MHTFANIHTVARRESMRKGQRGIVYVHMVTLSTYYLKRMCLVCKYTDCRLAVKIGEIPPFCISGIVVTASPSPSNTFIHYTTSEQSVFIGMLICDTLILAGICVLVSVLNTLPSLLSGVYCTYF